jgi:DNA primase
MGLFLSTELELRLCVLPDGLDPCDFLRRDGGQALLDRLAAAPDAFEYRMPTLRQAWAQPSLEIRQRALDGVLADLANVPEMSGERSRMKYDVAIRRVSEATGLEELRVRRRLAEIRKDGSGKPIAPRPLVDESAPPTSAMNRRERELVQWLVCHLGRAGEILPLLGDESVRHPSLRRLAAAASALYTEVGASAEVERLRERLNDPHLEDLLFELTSTAPTGESLENWLESLKGALETQQRRSSVLEQLRSVGDASDPNHHLEILKKTNKTFAS